METITAGKNTTGAFYRIVSLLKGFASEKVKDPQNHGVLNFVIIAQMMGCLAALLIGYILLFLEEGGEKL